MTLDYASPRRRRPVDVEFCAALAAVGALLLLDFACIVFILFRYL